MTMHRPSLAVMVAKKEIEVTAKDRQGALAAIPAVEGLLQMAPAVQMCRDYGRETVVDTIRRVIADLRAEILTSDMDVPGDDALLGRIENRLQVMFQPSLRPVLNLTGTVLHTNLGRAPLPPVALQAIQTVALGASNLEFDLNTGRRGDRDSHLEAWICRLTGAEAATVVNNNAAAVMLMLNALALRKEVMVSRGELVEIGGAFRVPDIMARAGAKLREVGTTNRTHDKDFRAAANPKSAMIMKVHASNYAIQGFTATVSDADLAAIARETGLIFAVDLGSGALVDLSPLGLPHEPTVAETLAAGADIVSFSGDKLLGGPQAGIIAGRKDLIDKIKKNPLKRAMRVDKMTIAALGALLPLYTRPEGLAEAVPGLRLLTRKQVDIAEAAAQLVTALKPILAADFSVSQIECASQIGSGAQPVELLASAGVAMTPHKAKGGGSRLKRLAKAFRDLPLPVIGRINDGALIFDLRCLENPDDFIHQLPQLLPARG